jgi:proteasome accessory factor C
MIEQRKVLRVLHLIKILSEKPNKTKKELAKLLEISERTVYRYIELLEELGYLVDKDDRDAYFLFEPSYKLSVGFEPEETELLGQLISAIEEEHPLRESLRKKIYSSSYLLPLVDELKDRHLAKIINRLNLALSQNKQVCLRNYQSSTSPFPRDRYVEPLSFVKANSHLCAFDLDSKTIRHFKIKRIGDVELLDQLCQYDKNAFPTDFFGFTSEQSFLVNLRLTKRAYRLLIEEFPDVQPYTSQDPSYNPEMPFRLRCEVRSPIGIGRFILGLPGEILVEGPDHLKEYLKKRIEEFQF